MAKGYYFLREWCAACGHFPVFIGRLRASGELILYCEECFTFYRHPSDMHSDVGGFSSDELENLWNSSECEPASRAAIIAAGWEKFTDFKQAQY